MIEDTKIQIKQINSVNHLEPSSSTFSQYHKVHLKLLLSCSLSQAVNTVDTTAELLSHLPQNHEFQTEFLDLENIVCRFQIKRLAQNNLPRKCQAKNRNDTIL